MACELHIAMSQNSSCCTQVFRLAWNWSHHPHRRGRSFWPRPGKGRIEVLRIIKPAWCHSFLIFSFSLQTHLVYLCKFYQIELPKPNPWILKAFYCRPGRVEPYQNTHTEQRIAKLVQTSGCNPPGPRVAQSLCLPSKRCRRRWNNPPDCARARQVWLRIFSQTAYCFLSCPRTFFLDTKHGGLAYDHKHSAERT